VHDDEWYEPESCISEVQRVRLSRSSCIIRVKLLVPLFRKRVKFCNSVIECLLVGWHARSGLFIIEYREVEGKSKTARVCWRQFSDSNIGGGLVSIEGLVGRVFPLVACGKLSQVAVVITHPRMKGELTLRGIKDTRTHILWEHLRLAWSGRGNKVLVEDVKDVLAIFASSDSIFSR
jgi:hypothetical protein